MIALPGLSSEHGFCLSDCGHIGSFARISVSEGKILSSIQALHDEEFSVEIRFVATVCECERMLRFSRDVGRYGRPQKPFCSDALSLSLLSRHSDLDEDSQLPRQQFLQLPEETFDLQSR